MSLHSPGATRLRWSSSLLEILAEPNGDAEPNGNAERQRAAASLLRLLIHPDVQDKLEAVAVLHTERRLVGSLSRAIAEGELVVSEEVVSHLLMHGPATFRGVYLRACAAYPERVRQHIAQLDVKSAAQTLAMDSVFRGRHRRTFLSAQTRGWLQDRVATLMKPRGPLGGPRRDLHLGLRFDREHFNPEEDLRALQSAPDIPEVWQWLREEPEILERALDALVLPAWAYEREVDGSPLVDVSTMGARVRAAYNAGVDAERVMEHIRFVDSPASFCAHLLARAKEQNEEKYYRLYRLMRTRLCLDIGDIGDFDALDAFMVEEVFVYGGTSNFRASEAFTAWALHKPSLFEAAFLTGACCGQPVSDADVERAHKSETLIVRIAAMGIDASRSDDAARELERLCAEAEHVVERAEALRALRSACLCYAARVALTQLHDLSTHGTINAPMRIECAATITPEFSDEDAFDRLVEARLSATEPRFDDDSNDGAWDLEQAIANWFEFGEDMYPNAVRMWTASYVSSAFRRRDQR